MEEVLGLAVIEPVDDPFRHDRVDDRIVGENLDGQLLMNDLLDSHLLAVGKRHQAVAGDAAEHDADLLPQLVDEDGDRLRAVEVGGQLAQRLAHQPGLEADVGVAHLPLDLGPGHEGGHRVDHDHVERARPDQHVGDLEALLPGVGLGDQQVVDVDADGLGVHRIHGVLGVDVGAGAAVALGLGHHVHGQGGLPRRLGPEDLHDPPPGEPADPERHVEGERPCGDHLDLHVGVLAQPHDRALAELLLDLAQCHLEGLVTLHWNPSWVVVSSPGGSRQGQRTCGV